MRLHQKLALAITVAWTIAGCSSNNTTQPVQPNSAANRGSLVYTSFDYAGGQFQSPEIMLADSMGGSPKSLVANTYGEAARKGSILSLGIDPATRGTWYEIFNNDGSVREQISPNSSESFTGVADISPDGNYTAFIADDTTATYEHLAKLYVSNVDGSNRRVIDTAVMPDARIEFSPDGRSIGYYAGSVDPSGGIVGKSVKVASLAGGSSVKVASVTDYIPDNYSSVHWQPNGASILYSSGQELHIVSPDGSGDRIIDSGYDAAWSPDGKSIAYAGQVGGAGAIIVTSDQGATKQVVCTTPGHGQRWPQWSLDGKRIFCETWTGDYDHSTTSIELIDLDTKVAKIVATPGIRPFVLR